MDCRQDLQFNVSSKIPCRMKIRAHLRDLNVYRNLERPLQFSEDIWNAFYQSEVQLKATRQLKEITE